MKTPLMIVVSVLVLGFAGCASNPASAMKKAGLRTVTVDSKVDSDQGMRYGVDMKGGLGQMLASAIIDSAGQKGITRMSEVMQSNQIVVSALVKERVVKRLQHNPDLVITNGEADATFVVSIFQFGFDATGLSFSKKVPFVLLRAELWDRKGHRLWRNTNSDLDLTTKEIGATWDGYEADPEKLRADWIRQIDSVVAPLFPETKETSEQHQTAVSGKPH